MRRFDPKIRQRDSVEVAVIEFRPPRLIFRRVSSQSFDDGLLCVDHPVEWTLSEGERHRCVPFDPFEQQSIESNAISRLSERSSLHLIAERSEAELRTQIEVKAEAVSV